MNQQFKQALLDALAASKTPVIQEQVETAAQRADKLVEILQGIGCTNIKHERKKISFVYQGHACKFMYCDFGDDDQDPLMWELIVNTGEFDLEDVDTDDIEEKAGKIVKKLVASGVVESDEDYLWDYDECGGAGEMCLCINNGEHID